MEHELHAHQWACSSYTASSRVHTCSVDQRLRSGRNPCCSQPYVSAGPADKALQHFEQLGHKCPERHNPAEFLADLISVDYASSDAQASSR